MSQPDPSPHAARLIINLDALAANYRKITAIAASADVAAVIKADAYGLGMQPVARRLAQLGCRSFFVAHYSEGVALRAMLPDARIYVLHPLSAGLIPHYLQHHLRPVLNSPQEVDLWKNAGAMRGGAILNIDTGMSRLGISIADLKHLAGGLTQSIEIDYVMSHLACADEPCHPLNQQQLHAFQAVCALLPGTPASLANTAGTLLGPDYHFDLVRPGIGLYGGAPAGVGPSPFQAVVALYARILQLRDVDSSNYVGYGATYRPGGPARIAVAGIGYADGYMRALGNTGFGAIGGQRVPLAGRISMDLCVFDVTGAPCTVGDEIELIGPTLPIEESAVHAGTINYEILTRLGSRFTRHYINGAGAQ